MRKVKTFFTILINSIIPNNNFYKKIQHLKFAISLQYFILFIYFICLIYSSILLFKIQITYNILGFAASISNTLGAFPGDLKINIHNGYITTNYDKPYFMWIDLDGVKTLLLVVDTTARPEQIYDYHSIALMTGHDVVINNGNQLKIIPMQGKTMTITKEYVTYIQNKINTLFGIAKLVLIPLILLILPVGFAVINLIYILIASGIVFTIFAVTKIRKVTFKKVIQVSFHAFTLPVLLNYTFGLYIHPSIRTMPYMFLIMLILFIYVGTYEAYDKQTK